ncbi:MAG: hypothetical protein ACTS3F_12395 [Phycisphaerales bacterium]
MVIHDGGLPSLLALTIALQHPESDSSSVIAWIPGPGSPIWADAHAAVGQEQAEILARTSARALGVRIAQGPTPPTSTTPPNAKNDQTQNPIPHHLRGAAITIELLHALIDAHHADARLIWPACPIAAPNKPGSSLARMFALAERARLIAAITELDATAIALDADPNGHGLAQPAPNQNPANPLTPHAPPTIETPFLDLGWRDLIEHAERLGIPLDLCWGTAPPRDQLVHN